MAPRKKEEPRPHGTMLQAFGTKSVNPVFEEDLATDDKPDFFRDIQNYFTKQKQITAENKMASGVFIQARFVSMAKDGFDAAAAYNRLSGRLPAWARAVVLYHLTPWRPNAPRMQYIKAGKNEDTDAFKEVLVKLSKHFHCGPIPARQIYAELEAQGFDVYAFFGLKTPRGYAKGVTREKEETPVVQSKGVPKPAPKRGNWKL